MTEHLPGAEAPVRKREPLSWVPVFLAELESGGVAKEAVRIAGICSRTAYDRRRNNPAFAAEWDRALAAHDEACSTLPVLATSVPQVLPETPADPHSRPWRTCFFEALAETSNVVAAAAHAGVAARIAYRLRREDRGFAEQWQAALHEGYDNLEMELLGYLRNPQPRRKMDVASALRLLAAHRATVERRRALEAEEDEQALLESIDRFIDDMRERRAANTAILIEAKADDGAE